MTTQNFQGQGVLVTGAGRGIGAAIAAAFYAEGAQVLLADVDEATATASAQALDATLQRARPQRLDVRLKADFEAALAAMQQHFGRMDVVVNNAGHAKRTPSAEISPEEFDDIVAVNMKSVFLSCQVFGAAMRAQGQGRIVNITSLAGQNGGTVASAHYASAKAGALMLTKYFAQELAGTGVTVNAISPGPIATAKGRLSAEQIAMIEQRVPIRRFGEASEIAAAALLLAGPQGGFFVGATLDMNGGLLMR